MNKYTCFWLVPLLVIGTALALVFKPASERPKVTASELMPLFFLPDLLNAKHYFSNQDLQGVVLLTIWASWCLPCQSEHSVLMKIKKNYPISIYSFNYEDTRQRAQEFLKVAGNPYKLIGEDKQGRASRRLGLIGVPETFLIDSQGIVRYRYVGVLNENAWETILWPLVNRYRHDY